MGEAPGVLDQAQLSTAMVLRGAVGVVLGAAMAPAGEEGRWAAVGGGAGALFGETAIVALGFAMLWRKTK